MFFSLHSRVSIISLFEGTYLLFFMVLEGNFFKASVEVQDPQTHASSPLAAWQAPAQHHTHPARDRFSHDRWTLTAGIFFSTIIFPSRSHVQVKFSVHI